MLAKTRQSHCDAAATIVRRGGIRCPNWPDRPVAPSP